jgi:CRISPR-associated endonuclease/helicase Cas3
MPIQNAEAEPLLSPTGRAFFASHFLPMTGNNPYPWQQALFDDVIGGTYPDSISLPTGAGKTSIIVIWLLAMVWASAHNLTRVPRRITWVINRRQVVDQTVDEVANNLLLWLDNNSGSVITRLLKSLSNTEVPLLVATLRGEIRDDHSWSANPEVPAIVVGTADMIGSRLLCRGYGESKYHQPKSAGLLAIDNLVVNDEAHLTPAFAKLIMAIEELGPGERVGFPFYVMLVSATNVKTKRPFSHDPFSRLETRA